ncbi:cytochrome P450 [Lentzea sp. NPDC005914]|uniref:cytochrome P450 n=1 Tax=Lentzea sp. NPDC005914 TaxID=3154572 RepID=UPI0033C3C145
MERRSLPRVVNWACRFDVLQGMSATFPFTLNPHLDEDPEPQRLLEEGHKVVAATMGPMELHLALSYQAVRQVLTDPRFSRAEAVRPGGAITMTRSAANPLVLTSMDPPKHTRTRKLVASAFSPRMIDALEPEVQRIVDDLLDSFAPPVDLVPLYNETIPIMVICALLGVPYADRDQIRVWSADLMSQTISPEGTRAAEQAVQGYMKTIAEKKRVEPDDALISALVRVHDEDGDSLSEPELLANLQMLLVAGHETTVNQLGNSIVTLLRHPEQLALLLEQPSLIGQAVDELLRYTRLFAGTLPRVTTEEVELDGVLVPAGAAVVPMISAANRDPSVFPNPHTFDITRSGAAAQLGLAHGPHYCLGAQLAKMELRVALLSLFTRFPGLRLESDELTYRQGRGSRVLESLAVTW